VRHLFLGQREFLVVKFKAPDNRYFVLYCCFIPSCLLAGFYLAAIAGLGNLKPRRVFMFSVFVFRLRKAKLFSLFFFCCLSRI